jgi:rod shape-determining protein MreD
LLILSIVQLSIVPLISIGSVIPDLIIILVVSFSLRYGQFYGTIFGSISGLLFDLISGGVFGSAMFAKTISGFVAGFFYNKNKIDYNTSTMFLLLIVFISSTINSFFYLLISSSEIKLTASHLILEQGILPGIYTALFTLPIVVFNKKGKTL